jgi:hypothetical protein
VRFVQLVDIAAEVSALLKTVMKPEARTLLINAAWVKKI